MAAIASSIDVPVYIIAVVATVDDPREHDTDRNVAAASNLEDWPPDRRRSLITSAPAQASLAARQVLRNCVINTCSHSKPRRAPDGGRFRSERVTPISWCVRAAATAVAIRREWITEPRRRQSVDQPASGWGRTFSIGGSDEKA